MTATMEPDGGGTITINSLVVGTVHMYYGKMTRQDVLEIIETNFEKGIAGERIHFRSKFGRERKT